LQLLKFKIPGLHGNIIDEFHGYKYSENSDEEMLEYPPVVLALGTGGMLEAGYLVNEDWKRFDLLKEIIPLQPGTGTFVLPPPVFDLNKKIPG
jgi:hypothetical protein